MLKIKLLIVKPDLQYSTNKKIGKNIIESGLNVMAAANTAPDIKYFFLYSRQIAIKEVAINVYVSWPTTSLKGCEQNISDAEIIHIIHLLKLFFTFSKNGSNREITATDKVDSRTEISCIEMASLPIILSTSQPNEPIKKANPAAVVP